MRIEERDPGNAPTAGERMGFVYVAAKAGETAAKLQGDRIETPEFIKANGLRPDYEYYIEHQLMKPIGQLFGIMVEKVPGFKMPVKGLMDSEREKLAIDLLFKKALEACSNSAKREFMSKQFGVTMSVKPKVAPAFVATETPVAPTKPASQSKINTYFLHKAIVKEYTEEKEKAKKAKATSIKAKAKDGATKEGGGN
jgi:hypothetical protein